MRPPLIAAARERNHERVAAILSRNPKLTEARDTKENDFCTAAHIAAEEDDLPLLKLLYEKFGCNIDSCDRENLTPLHYAINE